MADGGLDALVEEVRVLTTLSEEEMEWAEANDAGDGSFGSLDGLWSAVKWLLIALNIIITLIIIREKKAQESASAGWWEEREANESRDRILVVIAHPDDEAMFLAPFLSTLKAQEEKKVALLCLSTGNYDGLGEIRAKELEASCSVLGVAHCQCIDDPELQDGPDEQWAAAAVRKRVEAAVREQKSGTIVTFDAGGVSGHPNHISTYHGVKEFLAIQKEKAGEKDHLNVQGFMLESTSLIRKYLGPLDIPFSCLSCRTAYWSALPVASFASMRAHASQFVWFRWLFVFFSRYGYVNTLQPILVYIRPLTLPGGSP